MYDYANNNANFFGENPVGKGNYWDNPNDESFNSNEFSTLSAKYFAEVIVKKKWFANYTNEI